MAKKKVADLLVDTIAGAGVEKIYGASGDSLNGITDSIRRLGIAPWQVLLCYDVGCRQRQRQAPGLPLPRAFDFFGCSI